MATLRSMKIRYSRRAIKDIDDIREYISRDNPGSAWVVAWFVRDSINVLEEWPYQGRATERKNVRRLVVTNYPYVVYYMVRSNDVLILHVRHSSRRGWV